MKYLSEDADRMGRQHLWERDVRFSKLKRITKAEARLHRINLSSYEHGYKDLLILGDFIDASNFGWQNRNYDRKYTRHFIEFFVNAFVNPKKRYLPKMIIYIYPRKDPSPEKYKQFLNQLNSSLPHLNVSKVEYAVDLFCGSPNIIRDLFEVLLKYLYISDQRKINMINDKMGNRHSNRLYRIGKAYKVYERGEDNPKQEGKGWIVKDLDRIRFEYTADREPLKKLGIDILKDLIDDPKFIYLNWQKYLFKHFNYRRRLHKSIGPYERRFPAPHEPYRLKDESGVSGTFQSEYLGAKAEYLRVNNRQFNISPYLRQPYFLNKLESLLYEAMGKFGKEWRAA